jgi:hypothetical protein
MGFQDKDPAGPEGCSHERRIRYLLGLNTVMTSWAWPVVVLKLRVD